MASSAAFSAAAAAVGSDDDNAAFFVSFSGDVSATWSLFSKIFMASSASSMPLMTEIWWASSTTFSLCWTMACAVLPTRASATTAAGDLRTFCTGGGYRESPAGGVEEI